MPQFGAGLAVRDLHVRSRALARTIRQHVRAPGREPQIVRPSAGPQRAESARRPEALADAERDGVGHQGSERGNLQDGSRARSPAGYLSAGLERWSRRTGRPAKVSAQP